jgi:hypothetical protein
VQRYESNVTSVKQFHTKYLTNRQFMEKISRYNPEVCLLECFRFALSDEWKPYKGLLLNMSCTYHQTNLPMCAYMLFGGINRKISGMQQPQPPVEETKEIVTEIELRIRKARDQRN